MVQQVRCTYCYHMSYDNDAESRCTEFVNHYPRCKGVFKLKFKCLSCKNETWGTKDNQKYCNKIIPYTLNKCGFILIEQKGVKKINWMADIRYAVVKISTEGIVLLSLSKHRNYNDAKERLSLIITDEPNLNYGIIELKAMYIAPKKAKIQEF